LTQPARRNRLKKTLLFAYFTTGLRFHSLTQAASLLAHVTAEVECAEEETVLQRRRGGKNERKRMRTTTLQHGRKAAEDMLVRVDAEREGTFPQVEAVGIVDASGKDGVAKDGLEVDASDNAVDRDDLLKGEGEEGLSASVEGDDGLAEDRVRATVVFLQGRNSEQRNVGERGRNKNAPSCTCQRGRAAARDP
jgi:hypothetical protein